MDVKAFRTPLGRIRGLGSARHGTDPWWLQRLTALALIPLTLYFLYTFLAYVVLGGGSYSGAVVWLRSHFNAAMMILLLGVSFHHGSSGLHVVIEDYVHGKTMKFIALVTVKFSAVALALGSILAVLKILLST